MSASGQDQPGPGPARSWWRLIGLPRRGRVPLAVALVLLAILLALWAQRRPIAAGFIAREFERRGVPARYDVAEIGTSSQVLRNLVVGDPERPDLVADRVVVRTRLRLGVPEVTAIEAERVRLRARVAGGRLSLGAVDRLLPPPSGKPFALPALRVALTDARARVETPAGVIGARVSGRGRLDDGFRGRLALVGRRLASGDCAATGPQAALGVAIDRRRIRVTGPLRAGVLTCGASRVRAPAATIDAAVPETLDRWTGAAELRAERFGAAGVSGTGLAGRIAFTGDAAATEGDARLSLARLVAGRSRAAGLGWQGRYRVAGSDFRLAGRAAADRVEPGADAIDLRLAPGTPGAGLAAMLNGALGSAGRRFAASADLAIRSTGGRGAVVVRRADLRAASGARLDFAGARGFGYGWPGARVMLDGNLRAGGGGLPQVAASLVQAAPGAPLTGRALLAPVMAGGESLALAPVTFARTADGTTRIVTRARASLALPGGRVDGLTLPIDLRWDGRQRLAIAPGCLPVAAERLLLSSLDLRGVALRLCPLGPALFDMTGGRLRAGARIAAPRVAGTLGGSPLAMQAGEAVVRIGAAADFTLDGVEARLGAPERISRLSIGALAGTTVSGGAAGRFSGAAGAIGNVPLDLSQGAGGWRFADGRLTLDGESLRVADAAPEPRFEPLAANDFALTLAEGRIDAAGTLTAPASGVRVADVRIGHVLATGTGDAVLSVDNLRFDDKLQPDALTRLVFGVIADVKGSVSGTGNIRWSPEGVTSDGLFRTAGTDLAAAFGPVTGLSGEIRFTDLLGLRTDSAVGTIASVNPGIPVENGEVRYRLIGEQRVAVEGGRWPFAGGALVLDPTVLDLSTGKERRLTFRVEGVDAAGFLQQFDFSNLNATGTFDGTLPMIFDEKGGRIENGRLTVREGGGTLAYVGEVSKENLGTWGNFAFDALKSLRYERLDLTLNGPLDGEMVTEIRFAGVRQGQGAKSNFLIRRLARLPLVFNVTVRAPFRQLIDSVQSYYDPTRLIERNLPALLEQQQKRQGVQPPASEPMP